MVALTSSSEGIRLRSQPLLCGLGSTCSPFLPLPSRVSSRRVPTPRLCSGAHGHGAGSTPALGPGRAPVSKPGHLRSGRPTCTCSYQVLITQGARDGKLGPACRREPCPREPASWSHSDPSRGLQFNRVPGPRRTDTTQGPRITPAPAPGPGERGFISGTRLFLDVPATPQLVVVV